MSGTTESYLSHARYGKSNVRVLRVVREGPVHHIVEYNVTVLVEGDIDVSYTQADNSVVVATDSMKNITYYLAKTSPHILIPERFALHLGTHIVSKYAHLHKAFVTIEQLRWSRIVLGKQEHNHSFLRDGDEKKVVKVEVDATAGKDKIIGKVSSGISDLLVLKSTGSAFHSFVRDEYTLLAETHDRIFSTSVDLTYTFEAIEIPAPKDEFKLEFNVPKEEEGGVWDTKVWERARNVTLEVFAEDDSASVQVGVLLRWFSGPGCFFLSGWSLWCSFLAVDTWVLHNVLGTPINGSKGAFFLVFLFFSVRFSLPSPSRSTSALIHFAPFSAAVSMPMLSIDIYTISDTTSEVGVGVGVA
ncbi:hypothetical protein VNI00_008151 [Paramarasmius palmivorus]|uniref:factor independent urate hydroxylase n=1 Tax=Paramarasmius palmivorus TaxID=297713 RepID=A0AAW0CV58_9AGAR